MEVWYVGPPLSLGIGARATQMTGWDTDPTPEVIHGKRIRKERGSKKVPRWDPPDWLWALASRAPLVSRERVSGEHDVRLDLVSAPVVLLEHDLRTFDVWLDCDLHGSLMVCVRCGTYASCAPKLLGKTCQGDPVVAGRKGLAQLLKRIRRGVLPKGGLLTVSHQAA
eukprot:4948707-Amphidinium_carterae.1